MTTPARTVMIVEDEMIVAMDLQMQLEDAGWRVLGPVANVTDAHDLARQMPDAALLDVNISDGTTYDLALGLIAAGTQVVFLTGRTNTAMPTGLERARVLQKPLGKVELAQALAG